MGWVVGLKLMLWLKGWETEPSAVTEDIAGEAQIRETKNKRETKKTLD